MARISSIGLCSFGLLLAACAGQQQKSTAVAATTPASATQEAPAAATSQSDASTPIPDLDASDATPDVQWGDITLAPAEPQYDDLWRYLGENFTLPADSTDGRIQNELDWFAAHGEYLNRVAGRARPYLYFIVQQVEARKMPLDIALLPVVESAFDPFAY